MRHLFVSVVVSLLTLHPAPAQKPEALLVAAERAVLAAKSTQARRAATRTHVDLAQKSSARGKDFRLNPVEKAILEVLRDQVNGATGIALEQRVGQHTLFLAPGGWYDIHPLTACMRWASRRCVRPISLSGPRGKAVSCSAAEPC